MLFQSIERDVDGGEKKKALYFFFTTKKWALYISRTNIKNISSRLFGRRFESCPAKQHKRYIKLITMRTTEVNKDFIYIVTIRPRSHPKYS